MENTIETAQNNFKVREEKKDSKVWIIREPRIAISATNASSGSL
jgi:1,2-phenylacetyl-CoA epoxidase PaaB subunit